MVTGIAAFPRKGDALHDLLLGDTLLELVPAAIYVCDREGRIVRHNRRASELWGRSPRVDETEERFCGAHRLFRPDGSPLPHADTPMAEVLRSGEPVRDLEVVIEQPGGERRWLMVNIDPILGATGEVLGAINCFQDISARKATEQALHRSEDFLKAVVETTPECIKIVAQDGRLVQMNGAGLAMIEADGPDAVFGASTFGLISPEHRQDWRRNHERVCAGERLSWEFDLVGLAGARRHMETHAAPLTLPDGTTAQLAVTRDVTQRKRDEHALRESEAQCRSLLQALPTAVYTTDAEGRIRFYNEAAVEVWGREPAPGELWCGSWKIFRTDGTQISHAECPMAIALTEGRAVREVEILVEREDGTRVPVMPYPTPLRDASGAVTGAINMLVDISHHKRAAHRQELLIHELNHRVKNTLATVQSIANLTLRKAASPDDFQRAFSGRIVALSGAHDLLTRNFWEGAALREVLALELAPYVSVGTPHAILSGEEVCLDTRQALTLAMTFHELATNAAKYGALSSSAGRLEVSWEVRESGEGPELSLVWTERGGPAVVPPTRRGFGSTLLERTIEAELDGSLRLDFAPEGLRCEIAAPIRHRCPHEQEAARSGAMAAS